MAVQQTRKSRAKRDARRSHDALHPNVNISIDKQTGEAHLRHHMTADGYYRGRKILSK